MKKHMNQKGFTIVELMIATVVFSSILLLCAFGLLNIGRTYYKGVTSARTQEAARSIIDDIAQSIQFGPGPVYTTGTEAAVGTTGYYCAGGKRYSYKRDWQLTGNRHVLVVDVPATCNGGVGPQNLDGASPSIVGGSKELVPRGMRLAHFKVEPAGTDLYKITVHVISGDDDLLNPSREGCSSARAGTQYCATSELITTVQKRVR